MDLHDRLEKAWLDDGRYRDTHHRLTFSKGDLSLAGIHIAYTGLPPLEGDEETLRLLFMTEGFLNAGVPGNEIRKAWGLGRSGYRKDNPNVCSEPRDDHGCWTIGGGITLVSAKNSDATVSKKERFVDRFYKDAQKAADKLGVPVENILGICALKSGWGGADPNARLAREANNFFSQHYPAPYATGWIWNSDKTVKIATFSNISDSVRSFVAQYGHLVKGITDPEKFAAALQNAGKYGIRRDGSKVEDFVSGVGSTIRNLRPVIQQYHHPSTPRETSSRQKKPSAPKRKSPSVPLV